jgi:hypothetical protein
MIDLLWLLGYRRRGYARRRNAIEATLAAGHTSEARSMLLEQERRWSVNWQNVSRASVVLDLEHLEWIARHLASLGIEEAGEVEATARAYREWILVRAHFGIDGRMVKRSAVQTLMDLQKAAAAARERLHGAIAR